MSDKIYVSYLKGEFDRNKIVIPDNINSFRSKPECAFWGSPENGTYTWKDFCRDEGFIHYNYCFKFKLKEDSFIYQVQDIDDLKDIPLTDGKYFGKIIDFNELREQGFDGLELFDSCIGHMFLPKNKYKDISDIETCFNMWDCESIAIWNPDIIIPIEED